MKIKFEKSKNNQPLLATGTKVFTDSGEEIEGVTEINLRVTPNELVLANVSVIVTDIEGLENLQAVIETDISYLDDTSIKELQKDSVNEFYNYLMVNGTESDIDWYLENMDEYNDK